MLVSNMQAASPKEAATLIAKGRAPAGLRVEGHLDLSTLAGSNILPQGMVVDSLDLSGWALLEALPEGLQARRLNLSGCRALRSLPVGLRCYELALRETSLKSLPPDLQVEFRLDLSDCTELESLPEGLRVGTLLLRGCTRLTSLPEGLEVCFLDISGCTNLREWPHQASLQMGGLNARGCTRLMNLPPWLGYLSQLDISGCAGMAELPRGLRVSSWIDVADTALQSLPETLHGTRLRWRGVPVEERVAFHPETITAGEIVEEQNAELRRVLLERMGYETFLSQTNARVLDRDKDPGGERRLLRVPLEGDEDLVCLAVICPSTGRQYMLRVPPRTRTCRQAAAWIAGFDNEKDYRPIMET